MADLNAEIPDELMRQFKIALANRGVRKVKDGVAEALSEWIARDPAAPLQLHAGEGSTPIETTRETLELVNSLLELFQTPDKKWEGIAKFLKTELEAFREENPPK